MDMRNAKPSGVSARARQLRVSHYDRLDAVSHGKGEYAPVAALIDSGAGGKWDQTIYHHTHPPPLMANRCASHRPDLR
ncbi:hypothetical protein GCM10022244_53080 [Streptomyces gulbargensis]|uniref:Uncharacterized protein n=1 Tax=Streptomyces gulbargensis TaxID=364901 RepID=A0ABP7N8F0_9ACTN